MVQTNALSAFYPPQVLQNVFNKLDRVDFRCVLQPLCFHRLFVVSPNVVCKLASGAQDVYE